MAAEHDRVSAACAEVSTEGNQNLVSSSQWDGNWETLRAPRPLRPWRSYLSWRFAQVFRAHIESGDRILEVGCGGSKWLPYFAKQLGAEVWGIDFSVQGASSARAALNAAGADGNIVLGDLFTTTEVPLGYFDVVWSGGFVEHFTDSAGTIRRMAEFVKPGGLMISEVPNMKGTIGHMYRMIDPEFLLQHVPLSPEEMDEIHRGAGLKPIAPASYFGSLSLAVVNYSKLFGGHRGALAVFMRVLDAAQAILTLPLWASRTSLETAAMSPYVLGVYRRPSQT